MNTGLGHFRNILTQIYDSPESTATDLQLRANFVVNKSEYKCLSSFSLVPFLQPVQFDHCCQKCICNKIHIYYKVSRVLLLLSSDLGCIVCPELLSASHSYSGLKYRTIKCTE